ncbi:MAG: bifunctional hydroxymethylpyrimidine kinase/phosphomethylpyrimidine kinase [Gemmatimonadaceae bacterium]
MTRAGRATSVATSPPATRSSLAVVLSIAGSDSGGGAGIQADLKTFDRFGLFGTTVITAVTAQNTRGVTEWLAMPPALVKAQLDAVATDLPPAAVKSGMLADVAVVRAVAAGLQEHELSPYVLDPVMVATSGHPLLASDAIAAIVDDLFPLAALVTPNLDEAGLLLGHAVRTVPDMERAARSLVDGRGARAALVKGGHLSVGAAVDILFDGDQLRTFSHARVETTSTHGTGCTLSAAIAAQLALGATLPAAVELSLDYVHRAIATAPHLGSGHGPLNHFA